MLEFPKSGGPNSPFPRGGWTALMYAARDGAIDAARALVDLKARRQSRRAPADHRRGAHRRRSGRASTSDIGTTALVFAIINAHFDLAAMLLEHGADPNIADHAGMAALYAAVDMNTLQWVQGRPAPIWRDKLDGVGLVQVLLAQGADPNARLKRRLRRFPTTPAPR